MADYKVYYEYLNNLHCSWCVILFQVTSCSHGEKKFPADIVTNVPQQLFHVNPPLRILVAWDEHSTLHMLTVTFLCHFPWWVTRHSDPQVNKKLWINMFSSLTVLSNTLVAGWSLGTFSPCNYEKCMRHMTVLTTHSLRNGFNFQKFMSLWQ